MSPSHLLNPLLTTKQEIYTCTMLPSQSWSKRWRWSRGNNASGHALGYFKKIMTHMKLFCLSYKPRMHSRTRIAWGGTQISRAVLPTTRTFATSTSQIFNILQTFFNYLTNGRQVVEESQNVPQQLEEYLSTFFESKLAWITPRG